MQALIDFNPALPGLSGALRCAFDAPCRTLVARQLPEVPPLLAEVDRLARVGLWCVGYVRYEAATAFDASLAVHAADGPLAWFGVYERAQDWPAGSDTDAQAAHVRWQPGVARPVFDDKVHSIHQAITAGALYQVNYTQVLQGSCEGAPRALFAALQRAQPQAYAACIDNGIEQILSVSPELFFDWDGERILTRPMKGTAARGATPQADAQQAAALRASPKERAENVMIVDLLRNDLSRVAQPHSVTVPQLFQVEALPTVWQMSTGVQARTRVGTTLAHIFAALFPCGSVTGAPKVQAMQMIRALEPQPRGVYCGAIGVVRPGGHATFNVAIRTVTLQGPVARCGIGSGITLDASTAGEWQEWQHKRAFVERASQPFDLLETLRLEDGALRDAPLHLARMGAAAAHFGYPCPAQELQAALDALARQHAQGLWRVRLLLDGAGKVQARAFALAPAPARVRLRLASCAFEAAHSEFVRFKTTRRAHYEAAAPDEPGVFDTLLWNAQGEITEGTRCNVAVLIDGRWLTPALESGLLAGVARQRYLQQGRLNEARVRVDELQRVQGLAVFNSLRGWIPADLMPTDT